MANTSIRKWKAKELIKPACLLGNGMLYTMQKIGNIRAVHTDPCDYKRYVHSDFFTISLLSLD